MHQLELRLSNVSTTSSAGLLRHLGFVIHTDTLTSSITNFRVTDDIRSDHLTMEFDIISNTTISLESKTTKTIQKIDWVKFKSNLLNSSFETHENIDSKDDLDSLVEKLVETIQKSIENSTMIKKFESILIGL